MKTSFMLALVLVLLGASRAEADVGVNPGWQRPRVVIDAQRVHEPPSTTPQPILNGETQTPLPPDYSGQCLVDEEIAQYGCPVGDDPDPLGRPPMTEGDIRRAVEEIGLPRLDLRVQPGDTTLVNVATIFSTSPEEFDHSAFLLGYNIDLVAEPVQFDWRYGDGTTSTSSEPGRPYPAMDVTHAYLWAADDLRPSVDVTYRVTYRVDGGYWRTLSEPITAEGPAIELDVKEAVPVLAKR